MSCTGGGESDKEETVDYLFVFHTSVQYLACHYANERKTQEVLLGYIWLKYKKMYYNQTSPKYGRSLAAMIFSLIKILAGQTSGGSRTGTSKIPEKEAGTKSNCGQCCLIEF